MNKNRIEDALFIFQVLMAWVFSVPQILRMRESTEGITIALYVLFMAFILVNLSLARRAYKAGPSRSRRQAVLIYWNWTILIGGHLVALYDAPWRPTDSYFIISVAVIAAVTLGFSKGCFGLGYSDSIVRGVIACICKATPQIYLAYCIISDGGGAGLAAITVWAGHATVISRFAHIAYCGRQTGVDRNIKGMLLSEGGNELSWVSVTIAWLYYQ